MRFATSCRRFKIAAVKLDGRTCLPARAARIGRGGLDPAGPGACAQGYEPARASSTGRSMRRFVTSSPLRGTTTTRSRTPARASIDPKRIDSGRTLPPSRPRRAKIRLRRAWRRPRLRSAGQRREATRRSCLAQEPGALTSDRSPQGFHLVRVDERRPARVVPFEEAQTQVAIDLIRQDAAGGRRARTRRRSGGGGGGWGVWGGCRGVLDCQRTRRCRPARRASRFCDRTLCAAGQTATCPSSGRRPNSVAARLHRSRRRSRPDPTIQRRTEKRARADPAASKRKRRRTRRWQSALCAHCAHPARPRPRGHRAGLAAGSSAGARVTAGELVFDLARVSASGAFGSGRFDAPVAEGPSHRRDIVIRAGTSPYNELLDVARVSRGGGRVAHAWPVPALELYVRASRERPSLPRESPRACVSRLALQAEAPAHGCCARARTAVPPTRRPRARGDRGRGRTPESSRSGRPRCP